MDRIEIFQIYFFVSLSQAFSLPLAPFVWLSQKLVYSKNLQ